MPGSYRGALSPPVDFDSTTPAFCRGSRNSIAFPLLKKQAEIPKICLSCEEERKLRNAGSEETFFINLGPRVVWQAEHRPAGEAGAWLLHVRVVPRTGKQRHWHALLGEHYKRIPKRVRKHCNEITMLRVGNRAIIKPEQNKDVQQRCCILPQNAEETTPFLLFGKRGS